MGRVSSSKLSFSSSLSRKTTKKKVKYGSLWLKISLYFCNKIYVNALLLFWFHIFIPIYFSENKLCLGQYKEVFILTTI